MMTDRHVTHATFSIERVYRASPQRVFAAWADPAAKARWFAGPGSEHQLDFRVGGQEVVRGRQGGAVLAFESVYRDLVPGERIVYSSVLTSDERVATVSITTVEFGAEGEDTRLVLTEQGTFLDGLEQPSWRERGTSDQLDALGAEIRSGATHAEH
jgi:uncharacterized protein YndB with AHSA1/START domain